MLPECHPRAARQPCSYLDGVVEHGGESIPGGGRRHHIDGAAEYVFKLKFQGGMIEKCCTWEEVG